MTDWDLVIIPTPGDGSCLFHALANAFFIPYRTERLNGNFISRSTIISLFRQELAQSLENAYPKLANGNLPEFSKIVPDFTLDNMKTQLENPSVHIGYGFFEFISNAINKDIYIINKNTNSLYNSDELQYSIKGNRYSIILAYQNNHYELVGLKTGSTVLTLFKNDHPLITHLFGEVQKIIHPEKYLPKPMSPEPPHL